MRPQPRLSSDERFRIRTARLPAAALATFRVLAKGDLDADAVLASAVGCAPPPRSLTPPRRPLSTRGVVLREGAALPRLSASGTVEGGAPRSRECCCFRECGSVRAATKAGVLGGALLAKRKGRSPLNDGRAARSFAGPSSSSMTPISPPSIASISLTATPSQTASGEQGPRSLASGEDASPRPWSDSAPRTAPADSG